MNGNQLSGGAALQYQGTNAGNPPNVYYINRAPTINDYKNFVLGDLWVNKDTSSIYALVNITRNMTTLKQEATWKNLGNGGTALTFNADMGSAIPTANQINVVGGTDALTSAAGNTITINATGGAGGTAGTMIGQGAINASNLSIQYFGIFGSSAATTSASVQTVIPTAGTLSHLYVHIDTNTSTTNVNVTLQLNGVDTALVVPVTALTTGTFSDLVDTVTVAVGDKISFKVGQSTVGTFTGNFTLRYSVTGGGGGGSVNSVNAGTGITITGPVTDPIVNLTTPVAVANGGSGTNTLTGVLTGNGAGAFTASPVTQYGTVIAGASNTVTSVAPSATAGVPLISQGAAINPAYGTALVAGGGTGGTSFTTFAPVCGGTAATAPLQSAATGIGNAGYVLTSTGAGSLPTWQPTSASTVTSLKPGADPVVSPAAGVIDFVNTGGISLANGGANNFNIGITNFVDKTAWTPVVSLGATPVTSYNNREAYYARIGSIVFLWATININVKGAGVGNMTITGFPLSATHPIYSTAAVEFTSFDNNSYVTMVFNTATSIQLRISRNSTGLPLNTIADTNLVSGSGFTITAWYFTA